MKCSVSLGKESEWLLTNQSDTEMIEMLLLELAIMPVVTYTVCRGWLVQTLPDFTLFREV